MRAAIYCVAKRTGNMTSRAQQRPPLVLVVDDEESMRELVAEVLQEEGYRVVTARNGSEALSVALQIRPRLIVTDLMMPAMNGRVLRERLRDEPQTAMIPVVLMSAAYRLQPGDHFAATIAKPFGIDELIDVIERALPRTAAAKHN